MELIKQLAVIQQSLNAPKGQTHNYGKYKYRSCEDILEAVKPLLGELVLTISDEMVMLGDRFYVKATAKIESGGDHKEVSGYAREALAKKGMDEAQITGAASSYARKYALNGLFCIDDTKDADSTNKHGKAAPVKAAPELPKPLYDAYETILEVFNTGDLQAVGDCFEGFELKEEMVAVWNMFNSKQRSAIKKFTASDEYKKSTDQAKIKYLNNFQHSKFMNDFNLN